MSLVGMNVMDGYLPRRYLLTPVCGHALRYAPTYLQYEAAAPFVELDSEQVYPIRKDPPKVR